MASTHYFRSGSETRITTDDESTFSGPSTPIKIPPQKDSGESGRCTASTQFVTDWMSHASGSGLWAGQKKTPAFRSITYFPSTTRETKGCKMTSGPFSADDPPARTAPAGRQPRPFLGRKNRFGNKEYLRDGIGGKQKNCGRKGLSHSPSLCEARHPRFVLLLLVTRLHSLCCRWLKLESISATFPQPNRCHRGLPTDHSDLFPQK